MRNIDHFIGGGAYASGERRGDVFDPNNGGVQASVRFGTADDLARAVANAEAALPGWAATNPQRRARVMFNFKALVEKHMDELALLLSSEHGKVIADSKGDVQRGRPRARGRGGQCRASRLGRDQPPAPRPGHVQV